MMALHNDMIAKLDASIKSEMSNTSLMSPIRKLFPHCSAAAHDSVGKNETRNPWVGLIGDDESAS